jgi:putative transposase
MRGPDEISTEEGELYLATVLDLASRRLAGVALGDHHDSASPRPRCVSLRRCVAATSPAWSFTATKAASTCGLFALACGSLGVTQSMGRVGSALDNAAAESFNPTLEQELLSRRRFESKDQARRHVARFVDVSNHRRRHSSCEMLPPVAYEQLLAELADPEHRPQDPIP